MKQASKGSGKSSSFRVFKSRQRAFLEEDVLAPILRSNEVLFNDL